mmetsp:Transcript_24186/g.48100  ORF Transcript_24186/g.48100 Transcript_24186/m.48100 type:complete len:593 (+) Transcript_24186:92-1870(+)
MNLLLPPSITEVSIWVLALVLSCAAAQNLRGNLGPDDPGCFVPCDMGGCEFNNCNSARVSCKGGGCEIRNSYQPRCQGGGCDYINCEEPNCEGGGCTYFNCKGGDAPKEVQEIKIKKQRTYGEMTAEELEASFRQSASTPAPTAAVPRQKQFKRQQDNGDVDGFRVQEPENLRIKNYETENSELVKTGQGGVLDASWTVGGRVKGREKVEKEKQLRDLDQWAKEVKQEAEKEVENARKEKKRQQEEMERTRAQAAEEIEKAKRDKDRMEHEAQKAADLARQWKEYSELIEAQQKKEANGDGLVLGQGQVEEVKEKEEEVEAEVEEEETDTPAAEEAAKHNDGEAATIPQSAYNGVVNKIMALVIIGASGLAFYAVTTLKDIILVDFSDLLALDAVKILMLNHIFFALLHFLLTICTLIKPDFGSLLLCSPRNLWTGLVLLPLKFGYVLALIMRFLSRTPQKVEWFCRLFQVCALFLVADYQVQSKSLCPTKSTGSGNSTIPYFIGLVAYSLNLLLEVKIFESKMKTWDDEGEESQDEALLALLLELVPLRRSSMKKDDDEERGGERNNLVEEEKKESGGDSSIKKRRQHLVV